MTAAEIIALRAPQFSIDPRLSNLIALASTMTGLVYGAQLQSAIALRVMHWMTMEQRGNGQLGNSGAAGGITSESEGQLSRSYGSVSSVHADKYPDLAQTAFGCELIALTRSVTFSPMNRMMDNMEGTP